MTVIRCIMLACKGPLNRLVLGLLGQEIEKYTKDDEEVFVAFFHPSDPSHVTSRKESFEVRGLAGEFAKQEAHRLRSMSVGWSLLKKDGKKKLGCENIFFEDVPDKHHMLDEVVGCIVSLFEQIDKAEKEKQLGKTAKPSKSGNVADQMYQAMKNVCTDLKTANVKYRILSAGAVNVEKDAVKYADAFRQDLTVYDLAGSIKGMATMKDFMKKMKEAEKTFVDTGNLDGFAGMEQDIFISSVDPEVQATIFTDLVRENPPSATYGFTHGVRDAFFPYPFLSW